MYKLSKFIQEEVANVVINEPRISVAAHVYNLAVYLG